MEMTTLGNTGLKVSRLGAGLAEIGEELSLSDAGLAEAGRVLTACNRFERKKYRNGISQLPNR